MGRPKGVKDSKPRKEGRWSEQTRAKHGYSAGGPVARNQHTLASVLQSRTCAIEQESASSSNASQEQPHAAVESEGQRELPSAPAEGSAAAGREGGTQASSTSSASTANADEAPPSARAHSRAEAAQGGDEARRDGSRRAAPRRPVDNAELDDVEGLRTADVRDGVSMTYFRKIRTRLMLELSSRRPGLTGTPLLNRTRQPFFTGCTRGPCSALSNRRPVFSGTPLLDYLKRQDYWLRARDAPAILRWGASVAATGNESMRMGKCESVCAGAGHAKSSVWMMA